MKIQIISPPIPQLPRALAISVSVLLLILATFGLQQSQAQDKPPYAKATLIEGLKQRERDQKLTLQDFASLIQKRGVDFQMTVRDEAELRLAGASNEVIAAIANNYRRVPKRLPKGTGSLTINSSMSDCTVLVNGQLRGTTDINGILNLSPLKAGQYRILLKKENYEEQARSVNVAAGTETSESFTMTPLKGILTIIPSVSGATVRIRDNEYPDSVRNLTLVPSDYEVRVSKPGYKTVTRVVTISPGQPLSLAVSLEVLRIDEMILQGKQYLAQKNYRQAIATCKEILAAKPDEPEATLLLGMTYFYAAEYTESESYLMRAISLGQQVIVPIQHHRKNFGAGDDLCPGILSVGKGTFSFQSTVSCGKNFIDPYNKIYAVKLDANNRGGRISLKIGIPKETKIDKKGKKIEQEDRHEFNFHPIQARLLRPSPSSLLEVYCFNCLGPLQTIHKLIEQVMVPAP